MSLITPAGKLGFDWVPKSLTDKNVKTASDMHYDAIKQAGLIPGVASEECEKCCEKCKCDPCKCDKTEKEGCAGGGMMDDETVVLDIAPDADADIDIAPDADVSPDAALDAAPVEVSEGATVEEATAKIEEAVQDIKDAVGIEREIDVGDDAAEIDVSLEDPSVESITLDVGEDTDDKEVDASIEKESKKGKDSASPASASPASASPASASPASASPASASPASREASADDEFVKYAKISPANRKKLVDYWKNDLGFPPEYVKLMTTDFEK